MGQGRQPETITKLAAFELGRSLVSQGLPASEVAIILEGVPVSANLPRLNPPIKGVTGVAWIKISK